MKKKKPTPMIDASLVEVKTMDDLRMILSEQINRLKQGNTTAANVNAITNATGKILSTIKLEMEYAKLTGRKPIIPFIAGLLTVSVQSSPSTH